MANVRSWGGAVSTVSRTGRSNRGKITFRLVHRTQSNPYCLGPSCQHHRGELKPALHPVLLTTCQSTCQSSYLSLLFPLTLSTPLSYLLSPSYLPGSEWKQMGTFRVFLPSSLFSFFSIIFYFILTFTITTLNLIFFPCSICPKCLCIPSPFHLL